MIPPAAPRADGDELVVPPADLRRAAVSSWLGSALEYMDFTLYTLAAALVFGPLFFPDQSPAVALIASFGVYGSGFLIRPVGGLFFGRVGDRHGRKVVLIATLAMMGLATAGIGLLPTYAQIGVWAPLLLTVLRLVQGFGAGAELAGASLLMVESAPKHRRGFFGSVVAMGTNSGIFLATVLWLSLSQMPKAEFMSWGWRVPFLLSLITTFVALYLRTSVKESPVFEELRRRREAQKHEAKRGGVWRDVAKAKKPFLLSLAIRVSENGAVYLVKGFLVGYTASTLGLAGSVATTGVMIGTVIGFATVPLVGKLSDRYGRRPVFLVFAVFQLLFAVPALLLIHTENPVIIAIVFAVFVGGPLPNLYGVESPWLVEMFGAKHRYTFMSTVKEIGAVLSGGLAPILTAGVMAATAPAWWPIAVIMLAYAAIGVLGAWLAPETKDRDLAAETDAC
ncbi:MFS transporter [Saccharopolyspora sp. NPDC050389]|uniref:MFS transporter n=1 Tax=Saccharopolyspora sp. NPDC050389 TaxID=3155516 RepID=UPI0033F2C469